jgi:hypothetical protein
MPASALRSACRLKGSWAAKSDFNEPFISGKAREPRHVLCLGRKDARQHCNSRAANMKPKPAPTIPGNTEGERMSNALRMVLAVPKDVILAAEAKLKEEERRRKE